MKPLPAAVALLWIIGVIAASPAWSQWPGGRGGDYRDRQSDGRERWSGATGNRDRDESAPWSRSSGTGHPSGADKAPGSPGYGGPSDPTYDIGDNKKDGGGARGQGQSGGARGNAEKGSQAPGPASDSGRGGPAAMGGRGERVNPGAAAKAPGKAGASPDSGSHPGKHGYDQRNNKKM